MSFRQLFSFTRYEIERLVCHVGTVVIVLGETSLQTRICFALIVCIEVKTVLMFYSKRKTFNNIRNLRDRIIMIASFVLKLTTLITGKSSTSFMWLFTENSKQITSWPPYCQVWIKRLHFQKMRCWFTAHCLCAHCFVEEIIFKY